MPAERDKSSLSKPSLFIFYSSLCNFKAYSAKKVTHEAEKGNNRHLLRNARKSEKDNEQNEPDNI
jgi:hypothetical protein